MSQKKYSDVDPSHVCTCHISFIGKSTVSPVFPSRQEARNLLFSATGFLFIMFMLCLTTTLHFCPPLILEHHYLCYTFNAHKSRQSSDGLVCSNLNIQGPTNISVCDETRVFANMLMEADWEESSAASPLSAGSCSPKVQFTAPHLASLSS